MAVGKRTRYMYEVRYYEPVGTEQIKTMHKEASSINNLLMLMRREIHNVIIVQATISQILN